MLHSRVPLGLLVLAAAAACCSRGEPLPPRDPAARQIVARHAEDALDAFFSRTVAEDRAALAAFQERTASAATRADLESAWRAVPRLAQEGADFLPRRVFATAEADGDWPAGGADERDAWVGGVRDGVASFLAPEGR